MESDRIKVIIEADLNLDYREYHVKSRISEIHIEKFDFPLQDYDLTDLESLGSVGQKIVEHLATIEGIEKIFIKRYKLSVVKATAFDWEDVETDVLYAIEQGLGKRIRV